MSIRILTLAACVTVAAAALCSCRPSAAYPAPLDARGGAPLVLTDLGAYVIVVAADAPSSVRLAARDLQRCFRKATGASVPIVSSGVSAGHPIISLGVNDAARTAGVNTSGIGGDGYRITARGRSVFILGPDTADGKQNVAGGVNCGTANGVFRFCEEYLGVRWLMPGDIGEEAPHVSDVTLPAGKDGGSFDETYTPPFDYRELTSIGRSAEDEDWARRMRIGRPTRLSASHSWSDTIPASLFDKHPDWFAEVDGKPLTPTRRYKLETTNPALVQAFADQVIDAFRKNPDRRWYSLSPNDGSAGWSNSPASLALYEKDPHGQLSRTRLVLKFYNDVARIVGKQFPDRRLGGYIYASYLYPPTDPTIKLEPNVTLQLATSISYGFTLYRPSVQEDWNTLLRDWRERVGSADLYYYDLPTVVTARARTVLPPAPDILGFIFSHLAKYDFKGAYIDGSGNWNANAAGNYIIAELMWNPKADANQLLHEFCDVAYGTASAPHMEKLYGILGDSYRSFYNRHLKASYNMTPAYLTEIYGPSYRDMEAEYLKALDAAQEPRQRERLEMYGKQLSQLQNILRDANVLPTDFKSPLTVPEAPGEKIDPFAPRAKDL